MSIEPSGRRAGSRVSFETSFDSKQPKLEPKLVSALSETKRLFRLFRFYTETDIFDVSIEPKQTEGQPKQFDREHIFRPNLWVWDQRKSFMSYVRNDFTVTQKILETKWISLRKEVAQKIRQI
jgi:hypothetical protein